MYIRIVKMNDRFPHFFLFPFYEAKITKQCSMSETNSFKDLAFSNEPSDAVHASVTANCFIPAIVDTITLKNLNSYSRVRCLAEIWVMTSTQDRQLIII